MDNSVVLGLSGGVDSAVAAQRLVARGFAVTCVFLDIGLPNGGDDAAALAHAMGLPFHQVDIRHQLEEQVCASFARSYLEGRTPLPCALCNRRVKFPALLSVADALGCRLVATGHYARVADSREGRAYLLRGEAGNDQSYMLARLTQEQIQRVIFPLGDYEKTEVRAMAQTMGLSVANKPDSMEICFVPQGDYAAWLEMRGDTPPPGDFVDTQGNVLGRHLGVHHYTLGQGKGLGVSGPHRYFVTRLDRERNQVVLSDGTDLYTQHILCRSPNWISIDALTAPMVVTARFRHSKEETAALITNGENGTVAVATAAPIRAATPGQLAVFYDGEVVVGSAWID